MGEEDFATDKMASRAEVLGIPGPKRGSGPCVLPDHSHPSHLYFDGKVWKYWCAACDHGFSLAEVRAIVAYADIPYGDADKERDEAWSNVRPPGRVEVSRWAELLDFEAGLLAPRPVDLAVPDDLSASALRVATEIQLLLALRGERWQHNQEKFTFTRRMARARTGLPEDRARAALEELRSRRVIVPLKKKARRALVYRLGSADEVLGEVEDIDPEVGGSEVGDD